VRLLLIIHKALILFLSSSLQFQLTLELIILLMIALENVEFIGEYVMIKTLSQYRWMN